MQKVENLYVANQASKYEFNHNNNKLKIQSKPYRLIVSTFDDKEVCSIPMNSYFDAAVYCNGNLYVGDRQGLIKKIDIEKNTVSSQFFISKETEIYRNDKLSLYSNMQYLIDNHLLGDYMYLPETLVMNEIVANNSISVLHSYKHYLIAGDVSGNLTIWDTTDMAILFSDTYEGSVVNVNIQDKSLFVDFIKSDKICSPNDLSCFSSAMRSEICKVDSLNLKPENSKNHSISKELSEAAVELCAVFDNSSMDILIKIPDKFIKFINSIASTTYSFKYDKTKTLEEQNLSPKTKGLIALIYRDFLCDEQERIEYMKNISKSNKFDFWDDDNLNDLFS